MNTCASEDSPRTPRSVFVVAAATAGFLIATGIAYRLMAQYLSRPSAEVVLTNEALAQLPMSIDRWSGRDVPLEASVIRATATDAHVHRTYTRGRESVGLFVAYGIRARDLAPHRPEVCYPSSGWTLQQARPMDLPIADGSVIPVTVYRFTRGGVGGNQQVTVLNYYIVDGRVAADVSALRRRAWRGAGGIRYLAQVQITSSGDILTDAAAAERAATTFARHVAPEIRALFPGDPIGPVAGGP